MTQKCHSDCNKINILLSARTLSFPNTNHAHMVSIKEFSFVSTQLNILINWVSNLRVHTPWSLGPVTVHGPYWENKCTWKSGISPHWKEKMMGSSVDEEMTPVACAKVDLFCANTCLYSKHYCYYFHLHRLIFAAVKTWGSHVTQCYMGHSWTTQTFVPIINVL